MYVEGGGKGCAWGGPRSTLHCYQILMAKLVDIIAWNVRGMGDASKRCAIFTYLAQFQPAVLLLSETHFIKDRHYYHSTFSSHARGVSILVHRQIPFTCSSSLLDQEGRFVCLVCTIYNVPLILVAIYIHPPYSGELLKKILAFIGASPTAPVLLMGDFNQYLLPYWDKFHSGSIDANARPTSLARVLGEVGLQDVWRLRFPTSRVFSCYSSSHQSLSRIDLVIGSDPLIPLVKIVEYLPRSGSDHSPLRVQLSLGHGFGIPRQSWRLNPFWAHLLDLVLLGEVREFFQINASGSAPSLVWDTMKVVVRGLYIWEISTRKSKSRELNVSLQKRVVDTESRFISTPSEIARTE